MEKEILGPGRGHDLGQVSPLISFYLFKGGAQVEDAGTRTLIEEGFLELSLYPLETHSVVPNQCYQASRRVKPGACCLSG